MIMSECDFENYQNAGIGVSLEKMYEINPKLFLSSLADPLINLLVRNLQEEFEKIKRKEQKIKKDSESEWSMIDLTTLLNLTHGNFSFRILKFSEERNPMCNTSMVILIESFDLTTQGIYLMALGCKWKKHFPLQNPFSNLFVLEDMEIGNIFKLNIDAEVAYKEKMKLHLIPNHMVK